MKHTRTLITRKVIDGEEFVCIAPWLWENFLRVLDNVDPYEDIFEE